MLIDTHCHLNFKAFKNKTTKIINQAKKAGVKKFIVPGANLDSSQKAVELAQQYPQVYAAVGIHPHHAKKNFKKLGLKKIKEKITGLAKNKKVVAIGECGLDYYQTKEKNIKKIQKEVFLIQIKIAHQLKLPLIIHNRQSSNSLLKILSHQPLTIKYQLSGVLHCFQGNFNLLNWALSNNFYFGISGLITKDKLIQQAVKKIPLKQLLIETDSPFLTPKNTSIKKSFPNTPKNVKIVAQWIAKLKNIQLTKTIEATTKNAIYLFKLKNG